MTTKSTWIAKTHNWASHAIKLRDSEPRTADQHNSLRFLFFAFFAIFAVKTNWGIQTTLRSEVEISRRGAEARRIARHFDADRHVHPPSCAGVPARSSSRVFLRASAPLRASSSLRCLRLKRIDESKPHNTSHKEHIDHNPSEVSQRVQIIQERINCGWRGFARIRRAFIRAYPRHPRSKSPACLFRVRVHQGVPAGSFTFLGLQQNRCQNPLPSTPKPRTADLAIRAPTPTPNTPRPPR